MWARKRLDLSFADVAVGLCASLGPNTAAARRHWAAKAESAAAAAAATNQALACLSVRSGFDLLCQALQLPAGSEVIFSALTIHDMPRIVTEHGLIPVPADIDLATLGPTRESLERALTPNTRAVVIAHLCGARLDLTPAADFARAHNLLLIEDCAQAYDGPLFTGDPRALVSMFSFGTIKTATAIGGAVLFIRDADLLKNLRARQAAYRSAGRFWYRSRLLKNSAMKALSLRPWYGLFIAASRLLGQDYDKFINGAVRGFPGTEFFDRIRQQPPAALLRLLHRRLTRYNPARLTTRAAFGKRLAHHLHPAWLCPAAAVTPHSYWVFPILAANPAALICALRKAGFDATQGQSLCAVAAPVDRENLTPVTAQRFLREAVFLPIYPELSATALDRLAATLNQARARAHALPLTPVLAPAGSTSPDSAPSTPGISAPAALAAPSGYNGSALAG